MDLRTGARDTTANDDAVRDYLENWYRPNLRVKPRGFGTGREGGTGGWGCSTSRRTCA
ncbi:MAG: hypothetical protein JO090_10295 [Rhizobacter sp.]|nr:hypothetical protein [Rhizobacter sp.]